MPSPAVTMDMEIERSKLPLAVDTAVVAAESDEGAEPLDSEATATQPKEDHPEDHASRNDVAGSLPANSLTLTN